MIRMIVRYGTDKAQAGNEIYLVGIEFLRQNQGIVTKVITSFKL